MARTVILCVDDQREVLDALERDLAPFAPAFAIELAESADEADQVVRESLARGAKIGLVLADHLMPARTGVDLLVGLNQHPQTQPTRKVLVTAHAGLEDAIKAINEADLQHYIPKPWTPQQLHEVVRRQLTDFVITQEDNLLPYVSVLDAQRIMDAIRDRGSDR